MNNPYLGWLLGLSIANYVLGAIAWVDAYVQSQDYSSADSAPGIYAFAAGVWGFGSLLLVAWLVASAITWKPTPPADDSTD